MTEVAGADRIAADNHNMSQTPENEQSHDGAKSPAVNMARLGLGTVQFGLDYGVSNHKGQTLEDEVRHILRTARSEGLRFLDTAPAYGSAEEVIGTCEPEDKPFEIVTKTTPLAEGSGAASVETIVVDSFRSSCRKLDRTRVHGLMVHHAEDFLGEHGTELYDTLCLLKDQKRVDRIGVSIYDAAEIDAVLGRYDLDLIQVPLSLFDQRLSDNGYLRDLKRIGFEIHARSVFLQGLMLMQPNDLPPYLRRAEKHLREFLAYLRKSGTTPIQAALGFVREVREVDVALIGVNNLAHLSENIDAYRSAPQVDFAEWGIDDETILDPRKWANN